MHPKRVSGAVGKAQTFFLGNIKWDLFSRLKRDVFKKKTKTEMIKKLCFPL